jgi:multisubunit Na+/H+ antiporter MnhB subunit
MLYNLFVTRKKTFLFSALFLLLTAFCIWKTQGIERSPIHQLAVQFRGLITGMEVIIGLSAAVLIPVLYNSKQFEKNVL